MNAHGIRLGVAAWLIAGPALAQSPSAPAELPALVKNSCASCHTFRKDEANGQGPNLYGVIGSKAGSARGFAYSAAFKKALSGRIWTPELLDAWLTDTQQVAPDSLMTYFQDDPRLRKQIVDFLVGTAKP